MRKRAQTMTLLRLRAPASKLLCDGEVYPGSDGGWLLTVLLPNRPILAPSVTACVSPGRGTGPPLRLPRCPDLEQGGQLRPAGNAELGVDAAQVVVDGA